MIQWLRNKFRRVSLLQRGNQLLVAKEYETAIDCYLKHADALPDEAHIAFSKIAICFERSNVVADPIPVAPGITLVSQGDRQQAEYYYRLALSRCPDHYASMIGLANLLPNTTEKGDLLARAAAKQPGTIILIDLGDFQRSHLKDLNAAYDTYRKAQEHAPKDETAYRRLQNISRRLGRVDEAIAWGERWKSESSKKRRVDGKG